MRIFNVRQFGAKGDGATDDRAAIQAAIDAAMLYPQPGIVYFPPGIYKIAPISDAIGGYGLELAWPIGKAPDPFVCPTFVGAGAFPGDPRSPGTSTGPRSTIVLAPTGTGQVLFRYWRTGSGLIKDLAFVGRPTAGSGNRAGTLIETRGGETYGVTFQNVRLLDADVGIDHRSVIENETTAAPAVNSDMIYERLMLENLGIGWQTHHSQNLNYRFQLLLAKDCDTVLQMRADLGPSDPTHGVYRNSGGLINVDTAHFDHCGVTSGTFAIDLGVDHGGANNTRVQRFTNVRVTGNTPRVMRVRGDWVIAVAGFHEAQNAQGTSIFDIQNCGVAFEQSTFESHSTAVAVPATVAWGGTTTLRFRDCRFGAATFTRTEWVPTVANCKYSIEWCDGANNAPITNDKSAW